MMESKKRIRTEYPNVRRDGLERKVPFNISMDQEVVRKIDFLLKQNKEHYRNRSHFVEDLLKLQIKKIQSGEQPHGKTD